MCQISEVMVFLFLIWMSWIDIKKRRIPAEALYMAGVIVLLYQIINKNIAIESFIGGLLPGALFLILSKVTGEGIGYGDSLGILILGIYLGFWKILSVLMCSFFLLFCALIPILMKKKMSKKAGLAFYPFLTGGYLWVLIMGG